MTSLLTDWRHRPTHRRVWALAAPMILSHISVPLVALVDSMVIGHLPHAHQLGAVAVGASLYTFLAWAMGFLRMGSTGFAAQAAGRGDGAALRQILLQGLLLALGLAMLLGSIGIPLSGLVLDWMQPSPELNRSEEHTSELQSPCNLVCRLLPEKKNNQNNQTSKLFTK